MPHCHGWACLAMWGVMLAMLVWPVGHHVAGDLRTGVRRRKGPA